MNSWFLAIFCFSILIFSCTSDDQNQQQDRAIVSEYPEIDKVTAAIAGRPNDAKLYAERAALHYEIESYDNAIVDLKKAIELQPEVVEYHHQLADVYLDYFKSRLALETMENAVQLFPENMNTLLKLSEFQLILTKHPESLKTLDKILQKDAQNSEAYFMMGMNFKDMGDTTRAINSFQEAVDLNSNLVDGWMQLGDLYTAIGDKLALRYYDNAIRVAPEDVSTHHAKAYYLGNTLNDLEGAIEIYQTINTIDPQYEAAYYNAGLLYLDLDKPQEAYQQFDLAIKFSPTHIRAYFYRGVASEYLGNVEAARKDYEQALRMAPDYELAQEYLQALNEKS